MPRPTVIAALAVAAGALAAQADTLPPKVLISSLASHPSSEVPGRPTFRFKYLSRPFSSPDGSRWIMTAGVTRDFLRDILVVGSGNTIQTVLVASDPCPWDPTITIVNFDKPVGITDAGLYAFSGDTNAATAIDRFVIKWDGAAYRVVAREGDAAPDTEAGVTYGSAALGSFDSVGVADDGRVSFFAALGGTAPATANSALYIGDQVESREGVDSPTGQAGDPRLLEGFAQFRYSRDRTGQHWLVEGDLVGDTATDRVIIHDGAVFSQEGSVLAGSSFTDPVTTFAQPSPAITFANIGEMTMAHDGSWIVRGVNTAGDPPTVVGGMPRHHWVARNGVVVAEEGSPIFPGSAEHWAERLSTPFIYFTVVGNSVGDYIVGGATDIADGDETRSGVLVLNGERVILRSNDPVDLNGNGLPDDNLYIRNFDLDSCFLTPGGLLYCVVAIKDTTAPAGTALGWALLTKDVSPPPACPCDVDAAPGCEVSDIFAFLSLWFNGDPHANVNGDAALDVGDIFAYLSSWFAPAPGCD